MSFTHQLTPIQTTHNPNRLTIAIPTYNRASLLLNNLKGIAKNLPNWIHLLIVDNCSDPPVILDEDLKRTLSERGTTFEIHRNDVNIGGGANILRCFEHVKTEWFLLCGDDDLLDSEQLVNLKSLTENASDKAFIKFSSKYYQYTSTTIDNGVTALLNQVGCFNHLLFMSTFIFNKHICKQFLRFGYLMNSAYAPHVAIAILAAREHPFILAPIFGTMANQESAAWSPVDVCMCAYYLTDLPIGTADRSALIRKIYKSHNIGRELLDIVCIMNTVGMRPEGLFLRRKAIRTHLFFGHGIKRIGALILLGLSPILKSAAQSALSYAYFRFKGRVYEQKFISRHANL
ncbi:MAG: glycosyltransferase [Glaciimonas sp.]|nr:glycosyltransferase [Glaciimonas sp.]